MGVANDDLGAVISATTVIPATRVADATPVTHTAVDVRTLAHHARLALLLSAFETNAANTGGTWSVEESDAAGGEYTAATTIGSLAATGETAGNVNRVVSIIPNPAKPFVRAKFTGATADAEVDITAQLLVMPGH